MQFVTMPLCLPMLPLAWQPWHSAHTAFVRGGPVMWPLLGCSLLALTIVIERAIVLARYNARRRRGVAEIERLLVALQEGRRDEAAAIGDGEVSGPVGKVLANGLRHSEIGLAESLQSAADPLLDSLRHGLSILDTVVTLGPLLGILGTVTGIIRSFHLLSASGVEDPTAVTGGIAEALITTAAGLIVAILALVPFNAFLSQLRRNARELEQTLHRCEVAYHRGQADAPGNGI
ncbi:MAG: MotA/TolQ/ExbB proton channel family protein [Kiritimatiellae bacterium]|nr:MotA/TolQ/ExbB proton channel family protein [Kiritimatiellia bacterium]